MIRTGSKIFEQKQKHNRLSNSHVIVLNGHTYSVCSKTIWSSLLARRTVSLLSHVLLSVVASTAATADRRTCDSITAVLSDLSRSPILRILLKSPAIARYLNDVHVLDVDENTWTTPTTRGTPPEPRYGHSASGFGRSAGTPPLWSRVVPVRVRNILLQFSPQMPERRPRTGRGREHLDHTPPRYLNDVHVLDVDENTWTTPTTRGTPPEPRYGHSASLVGSRIVFFGGKGREDHFRDLHALDVGSLTWYQGPASGGAPPSRMGHSSTLYQASLFILGGVCGNK